MYNKVFFVGLVSKLLGFKDRKGQSTCWNSFL